MLFGIVVNLQKVNSDIALKGVVEQLRKHNVEYLIESVAGAHFGYKDNLAPNDELYKLCDIIIAIGGDGTIIHAAKQASLYNKAIIGVNSGRVGYIASLELSELDLLEKVISGDYVIESRMMLEACVSSEPEKKFYCLNDVVINKATSSKILDMTALNGNEKIISFRSDGVVVATPTGSTAYAMSAGGPVTDPAVDCIILVPICAMSMYSRGFVLPSNSDINLEISCSNDVSAVVKFDGNNSIILKPDETVNIKRADGLCAKLIKIKNESFYHTLKNKMKDF